MTGQHKPEQGVSRRGLFSFGLRRFIPEEEPEAEEAQLPPAVVSDEDPETRDDRLRGAWARCDARELWDDAAMLLMEGAPADPSERVLAIGAAENAAARLAEDCGAQVTGRDLADGPLDALPYEDGEFDTALATFAPMFALDPPAALSELFRVVRPGGTIGMTAWALHGPIGRALALAAHWDPSPAGVLPALAWGRAKTLRQALVHQGGEGVESEGATLRLSAPSAGEMADRVSAALGPLAAALNAAPDGEDGARLAEVANALAADDAVDDDRLVVRPAYIIVVARRPL